FVVAYTLLLGPMLARQDLRSDLLNSDILKTYPLRGWQVVFGEILTPIAILTGVLWLGLLVVELSFESPPFSWLTAPVRVAMAIGLAAAAVSALLALEAALGVRWLGARFDSFDLSAELRP